MKIPKNHTIRPAVAENKVVGSTGHQELLLTQRKPCDEQFSTHHGPGCINNPVDESSSNVDDHPERPVLYDVAADDEEHWHLHSPVLHTMLIC